MAVFPLTRREENEVSTWSRSVRLRCVRRSANRLPSVAHLAIAYLDRPRESIPDEESACRLEFHAALG